jgi:hypothetical protein
LLASLGGVSAHPADGLLQRASVEVQPTAITVQVSLLAGLESYFAFQTELDQRGNPEISDAELGYWLRNFWIPAMAIEIDGVPVALDMGSVSAMYSGPPEGVFLTQPLVVSVAAPIPLDGEEHTLLIRNNYAPFHSEYQLELLTAPGTEAEQATNEGKYMAVRFRTDPASPGGAATQASFSVTGATGKRSWLDRITDGWPWIAAAGLVGAVLAWLVVARIRDQAGARSEMSVRQSQAKRKKPVAVKTIDAPDE